MVTVNGIIIEYLGKTKPEIKLVTRGSSTGYKTIIWPKDKPLTKGAIQVEVAKQWKIEPSKVVILESVELPKI